MAMHAIDGDKLRGHLETLVLATLEKGDTHGLGEFAADRPSDTDVL
jgi:hypothetical protein